MLGSWTETTPMPIARKEHESTVYAGHVYVTGGYNGTSITDVLVAPLN
jgi:hypothetical protein